MEHDINPLRMGAFNSINWLYSCPDVLECTFSGINRVAVFEMFCYQRTVTAFCLLMFILVCVEKPPVLMENFISCDVTGNQSNCLLGGSSQRRGHQYVFSKNCWFFSSAMANLHGRIYLFIFYGYSPMTLSASEISCISKELSSFSYLSDVILCAAQGVWAVQKLALSLELLETLNCELCTVEIC